MSQQVLESFFREHYKKQKLGIVGSVLGEKKEYDYRFTMGEAHHAENLFPGWKLRWIMAEEAFLARPKSRGSSSYGLFAFNESSCLPLDYLHPESLETLLRNNELFAGESESNATQISQIIELVCDALLSGRHRRHQWVDSSEDFDSYLKKSKFPDFIFREIEKVKANLSFEKAFLRKNESANWILEFSSIHGAQFDIYRLTRNQLTFFPSAQIQLKQIDICSHLFLHKPMAFV